MKFKTFLFLKNKIKCQKKNVFFLFIIELRNFSGQKKLSKQYLFYLSNLAGIALLFLPSRSLSTIPEMYF